MIILLIGLFPLSGFALEKYTEEYLGKGAHYRHFDASERFWKISELSKHEVTFKWVWDRGEDKVNVRKTMQLSRGNTVLYSFEDDYLTGSNLVDVWSEAEDICFIVKYYMGYKYIFLKKIDGAYQLCDACDFYQGFNKHVGVELVELVAKGEVNLVKDKARQNFRINAKSIRVDGVTKMRGKYIDIRNSKRVPQD